MEAIQNFTAIISANSNISNENNSVKPRNTRDIVLSLDEYSNFLSVNFLLFCCS